MNISLHVGLSEVKEAKTYFMKIRKDVPLFPAATVDTDTYIAQAQVSTGLDFRLAEGIYNLQFGKYSAVADRVFFLLDLNHDYHSVFQGYVTVLWKDRDKYKEKIRRKGQIIVENDCWIGTGVTILSGVTIHSGAVVAAGSVVTKDVPPYAVVGGNPARIIKFRFNEKQIVSLLKIAWWDWPSAQIEQMQNSMYKPVDAFISDHISSAEEKLYHLPKCRIERLMEGGKIFLFFVDIDEPYAIYQKVIRQFAQTYCHYDAELVLYMDGKQEEAEKNMALLVAELKQYEEYDVYIQIFSSEVEETSLIREMDYYITNRSVKNVGRMCKAELFGVTCLSGVDSEIFKK